MSQRTLNVLLVDDHAGSRWVAESILREQGHTVTSCENGAIALNLCHEQGQHFDVILLNAQMPVMNGAETARYLRDHEATRNVPIIGISAFETILGADVNLFKPYRKRELQEALANVHLYR